jgi:isocitrate dehydrogenase
VLLTQNVETGDIWRMCLTKDAAIRDCQAGRHPGAHLMPVVFWLDQYRPHGTS